LYINRSTPDYQGLFGRTDDAIIENLGVTNVDVSGDNFVGGLVGYNSSSTVSNSFWDMETSGQTTSAGGTGKTTIEMHNVATYTDLATVGLEFPWDFVGNPFDDTGNEDFWDIDEEINNGYPYLVNPLISTDDEEITEIIGGLELIGNYPNPFNSATTIKFNLKHSNLVQIDVFNIKGQKVKTLETAECENMAGGIQKYSVIWNGTNEQEKLIAQGVYFYKVTTEAETKVKKMILVR